MVKVILTQIMKDESHVAKRMLDSVKAIVDGICIIDTGSTDNSIEIVKQWGIDNNIETYVFERPFDDFENSRNYSFEKAREVFLSKRDGHTYYNFWLDFDEVLQIEPTFNKQNIDKEFYMFNTFIGEMKYTRNEMARLDKPYVWYGPVHEYILPIEGALSGLMEGLSVKVFMDGGSWKTNTAEKYRKHAAIYDAYLNNKNRDPRWIFYAGQSYADSANVPDNRPENEERMRRSIKYFRERLTLGGYEEERFYSQWRIASLMAVLEEPWAKVLQEFLKAHAMDPLRAEPLKSIVDYYMMNGEWNLAYLYSSFARKMYHAKNPYPTRLLFVNENLYNWEILNGHIATCLNTGRKDEAAANYRELLDLTKTHPNYFNPETLQRINGYRSTFGM